MSTADSPDMKYLDGHVTAVDETGFDFKDDMEQGHRIDFMGKDTRIQVGKILHLRVRKADDGALSLSAIV